ncbi:RecQ family ATP-dependent DNA helicase [Lentiprolixibacter aurantiacus]|uniref:ATP-dependent DNA helicase RecQ n=1 Tax=Lentiprolixibacter aurantiacus TaxID=2993939 RepID=A0AAE3MLU8_9FLAO|nr:RecQ family ATP-dependent DNA helicase [Lentiprolixibacter aurantiacus]
MREDASQILKKYWGFESFRGSQASIIDAVLQKEDVLALLPTGGGKSVCYQVPALLQEGICIVVSPLIALIEDQVRALKNKGIKALGLTGGLRFEEVLTQLDNCLYGNYSFLYLSPERLQQELVREKIKGMPVKLIAIDEAHCISQWGHDFRPAYLDCAILRELHPEAPVMALTATATKQVARDIVDNLGLSYPRVFKDSFLRKNISYTVFWEEDKRYRLAMLCKAEAKSGIIYVRSRRMTQELAYFLNEKGLKSHFFHGGISYSEKSDKLNDWLQNKVQFMVATNAFGMGVDKPDVGLVVHYQIPDNLENYFQESGRAGRDGEAARAVLLTNKADETRLKEQFLGVLPSIEYLKLVYRKLNNYFQIPYGGGEHESYPFHFDAFCEAYDFQYMLTYNALQILDQQSVISLSQEFSRHTTVKFEASKQDLFNYMEGNQSLSEIIQVLLRTYGGVFDFETRIKPVLIARKSGKSENEVFNTLKKMEADGLVSLNIQDQDMKLTFLIPREDDLVINRFAKIVTAHHKLKEQKLRLMLDYVENDRKCRSKQLLHYFGEELKEDCRACDVCRRKYGEFKLSTDLPDRIMEELRNSGSTSRDLIARLPDEEEIILESLREMLEDGSISLNHKNEYILNT